jgi:hypothetical protein
MCIPDCSVFVVLKLGKSQMLLLKGQLPKIVDLKPVKIAKTIGK